MIWKIAKKEFLLNLISARFVIGFLLCLFLIPFTLTVHIDEYVFYRQGSLSWSIPYIAGVYALAVQVEPDITPERFWDLAMKTSRTIELEHKGERRSFGSIVDPVRLIRRVSRGLKQ
ncbi:hypothetical protein ACFL5F_08000 [Planctomycetota bacterium]